MRRLYCILLWSASGLVAGCAMLVFVALLAIPLPTQEELAGDSTVPTPSSGPGHGWRYASDGTRLYERVYPSAGMGGGAGTIDSRFRDMLPPAMMSTFFDSGTSNTIRGKDGR